MTIRMKTLLGASLGILSMAVGQPQTAEAAQPVPGLQCMALNLTPAQMANNLINIPILAAPSSSAQHVANATSVVLVKDPVHEVAGYDEVVRLNGHPGWVAASDLKTWHSPNGSSEKCIPAIMSTGRYGFVTSN